jgi:hypothetical protein
MTEKQGAAVRKRRGRAEIEQLVGEFVGSGMRQSEFCQGRGLALSTLQRHLKKQGRKRYAKPEGRLVPVEIAGRQENDCTLALTIRGHRIEVRRGFDESTLRRLVDMLERG